MKNLLFFLLLAFPFAAFAQRTEDDRAEDRFAQKLDLTNAQEKRWLDVHRQYKIGIDRVQADETLTPVQRKSQLKKLHDQRRAAQRELLTPEQARRFDELRQERRQTQKMNKNSRKSRTEQVRLRNKANAPKTMKAGPARQR